MPISSSIFRWWDTFLCHLVMAKRGSIVLGHAFEKDVFILRLHYKLLFSSKSPSKLQTKAVCNIISSWSHAWRSLELWQWYKDLPILPIVSSCVLFWRRTEIYENIFCAFAYFFNAIIWWGLGHLNLLLVMVINFDKEETRESSWDRLKLSPHTVILEVGGVIDDHYASLTSKEYSMCFSPDGHLSRY